MQNVMKKTLETVLDYHQRTKHQLHRYAAGPGALDWASQPDPFRTFSDCPRRELPLCGGLDVSYASLYRADAMAPQIFTQGNVATLLELSFGLSAWKQYGSERWALRCNPSSGNLHPTECYVIAGGFDGLAQGVYHYLSLDHVLEQRCLFEAESGAAVFPDTFLLGLTSIHWREAWKYGERAYRYCQHDVGHAIAAVRYAAAALGWQVNLLDSCSDNDVAAILGIDRDEDFGSAEREHPDVLLQVTRCRESVAMEESAAVGVLVQAAKEGRWVGQANRLSSHQVHAWPVIDEVADACEKPGTSAPVWLAPMLPEPINSQCERTAADIIRQRRSAQSLDGVSSISRNAFYRMLDMTLPRRAVAPWDAIAWAPRIHLLLFVHRVDDLEPGLYLFLRHHQYAAALRTAFSAGFEWARPEGCPEHFQLFRLEQGDARNAARTISCRQDIAADGAFSLAMLAEYENNLEHAPWVYRQLFWEAGMLGQVLYLEAEAAGVRGTGIGCFFDDAMHDLVGLKGQAMQSLYHFTVGGAVTDSRLQTLPAYAHLKRAGA